MKRAKVVNYHARPLNEMKAGETLYAQRTVGGMLRTFFGKLVRIDRGQVVIEGCWIEPEYERNWEQPPVTERFVARRCYLWGRKAGDTHDRCLWFERGVQYPAGTQALWKQAATAAHAAHAAKAKAAKTVKTATVPVTPKAQVDLRRVSATEHGGCNGCGDRPSTVIRADLLYIAFRVCDTCAARLMKELGVMIEPSRVNPGL